MKKLLIVLLVPIIFLLTSCQSNTVRVEFIYHEPGQVFGYDTYKAYNREYDSEETYYHFRKGSLLPLIDNEPSDRGGWIFVGWAQVKTGDLLWDFQHDVVNQDLTLYSIWRERDS